MPSTAADAAGLLAAAIADPNPVVVVENKTLYFRREELPDEREPVPIGRANVVRPGRDVTVVALSRLVSESVAAADELAEEGIDVEVIDPRTLVPLDLETIVESVRKTHRLVIAHEAVVARRLRRGDRRRRCRPPRSTSSTRRSSASARRSRPFPSARRSRTPTCRAERTWSRRLPGHAVGARRRDAYDRGVTGERVFGSKGVEASC